jgi:hypothetical protein
MDNNKCPMCGSTFRPVNGMTPEAHLSKPLLLLYRGIQEDYTGDVPLPCPRCGKNLCHENDGNTVSRYEDVIVCEECGIDESEREANGNELPVTDWHIISMVFHCVK